MIIYVKKIVCTRCCNCSFKQNGKANFALEQSPKRYPLVDKDPFRTEGIRKVIVNKFLVYFWIDEVNQVVQVTAVIYEKRDQVKQLKKMKLDD